MHRDQVGLYAVPDLHLPGLLALARDVDAAGLGGLWFTDLSFVRDPLVHASAVAGAGTRTPLGLGLVHAWQHVPAALATAVATLAQLCETPPTLVLGPWHEPAARTAGVVRRDVVRALDETTRIVVPLLRGETVELAGRHFAAHGARLAGPVSTPGPVLWGANGPRMVAAAGDLVAEGLLDGVMINYLHTTERVGEIAVEVRGRAEQAGRDPDSVQVQAVVMVAPSDDEAATVAQLRAAVTASPMLRHEAGFGPDDEISEDDVRLRVAAGPAWTARVDDYLRAGASGVTLFTRDPSAVLTEASGWA